MSMSTDQPLNYLCDNCGYWFSCFAYDPHPTCCGEPMRECNTNVIQFKNDRNAVSKFILACENFIQNKPTGSSIVDSFNEGEYKHKELQRWFHEQELRVSETVASYIMSQFVILENLKGLNKRVFEMAIERMHNRFNTYYKMADTRSEVLVSDLNHMILAEICPKLFHTTHLSPFRDEISKVYHGVRYGEQGRVLFLVPVQIKHELVNIVFLLDTGSGTNFISEQVMETLGLPIPPSTFRIEIAGVKTEGFVSSDVRFEGINIIGDRFLRDAQCRLIIDYKEDSSRLEIGS